MGVAQGQDAIREVNFNESSYRVGAPYCDEFGPTVKVHEGRFANDQATFQVAKVMYANLTGPREEQAVVVVSCAPKVAAHPGFENDLVYVYGIRNGQPELLGVFAYGTPWNFTGYAAEPARQDQLSLFDVMDVSVADAGISFERRAGSARCCPTFVVTQTFKWANSHFELAAEHQRAWKK
jgi:hypothetical protein